MEDTNKKTLSYIGLLKFFAITLVVIGHSNPPFNLTNTSYVTFWQKYLHIFIYNFHMPLFLFIAGFLFFHTNKDKLINYKAFIYKKLTRLLIPFISINLIGYILKVFYFNSFTLRKSELGFNEYFVSNILYPSPQNLAISFFWFLPVLFSMFVFAPALKRVFDNNDYIKLAIVATFLLFFNIFEPLKDIELFNVNIISKLSIYFFIGAYFNFAQDKLISTFTNNKLFHITLLILILSGLLTFKNNLYALIIAIIGIYVCFHLSYNLSNQIKSSVINCIGVLSYQIYLLSWFFQLGFKNLYIAGFINFEACIFLMLLGGILGPIIVSKIISNYIPRIKVFIGL